MTINIPWPEQIDRLARTTRRYTTCPVCGSAERSPAARRPYRDRYMRALASELGIAVDEVPFALDIYECDSCESIYSDPWLNAQGMYALYGTGHPQHLLGWEIFFKWANASPRALASQRRARLWRFLESKVGRVETFGQLNCPFFGPLLYFDDLAAHPVDKVPRVAQAFAQVQSTYLHPYRRNSWFNRLDSVFRRKVLRQELVVDEVNNLNPNRWTISKLRRAISRAGGTTDRQAGDALPRPLYQVPDNRYLLFEPSSCFWSANCSSLNCSCRSLSGVLLDTPSITLADVRREGIHFDLFCVFNALDHFLEPKEMLNKLLDVSKFVFFDTHKSDEVHAFSRQHFYVFGKNALARMADPDWHWLDVTDDVGLPGQNAFIVSRGRIT